MTLPASPDVPPPAPKGASPTTLVCFDLDHTLLDGDSDQLWCEFLLDRGELDRGTFEARNAGMERDYRAGTVSVAEFSAFYVSTLAGRTPAQWQPLREAFLERVVRPLIKPGARGLVQRWQATGALVLMTTATNRFITEMTAAELGVEHLLATECELDADGRFTGAPTGTLNMREGKVARLVDWLQGRGLDLSRLDSHAYSDSLNDLALLSAVRNPVVVDGDTRLLAKAALQGWPVISLRSG